MLKYCQSQDKASCVDADKIAFEHRPHTWRLEDFAMKFTCMCYLWCSTYVTLLMSTSLLPPALNSMHDMRVAAWAAYLQSQNHVVYYVLEL